MGKFFVGLMCAFMLSATAAQAQAQKAGTVLFASGEAMRVSTAGATRLLARGDTVFEGDVLRTGPSSHLQLRMSDEALIALRPDSSLRVQRYAFSGREDGNERALFELMKGAFRSITGVIGRTHKDRYGIHTHNTVLGIRGTDHETFLVDGPAPAGTYNRVTLGGTYLQTQKGRIELDPGETGFAPAGADALPVRLPGTPAFVLAALPQAASRSGPAMRGSNPGDEQRLQAGERLPDAAFSGMGRKEGVPFMRDGVLGGGGRCGGPCLGAPAPDFKGPRGRRGSPGLSATHGRR